jgi:acetyl-CoA C-acetyltransferase
MSPPSTGQDRLPCLIGTARRTWHPGDVAPEPLAMWEEVARSAARDAGARVDPLARVDDLSLVHCQSWAYDDAPMRLAERLDLAGAHLHESILAGTSPQRLLDAAAERMLAGRCEVALVVGGEALATRRAHDRAGEAPDWSHPHPAPPLLPVDLEQWYLPTEIAHGVLPAWLTFALLEQARWRARGGREVDRADLAATMRGLSRVAAGNPDAWFRSPLSLEEISVPSATNRMVADPYTKRMTAFMDVDMAAANLLVTHSVAERWRVPEDRRVYLRGWGFARDSIHLGARADLTTSPAMRAATREALSMAGPELGGMDGIDVADLYSCFGSAVQFARDALGLASDDPRPISVTGGLPYHGGPSSNYMSHSISHMADHLRLHPDQVGLVTGVGMHMTKHVAAVWSVRPGAIHPVPPHHREQQWDAPPLTGDVEVVPHAVGRATVLAATVVHRADGCPDHAVAICELPDGSRCYARSADPGSIGAVTSGAWVTGSARLTRGPLDTNEVHWT